MVLYKWQVLQIRSEAYDPLTDTSTSVQREGKNPNPPPFITRLLFQRGKIDGAAPTCWQMGFSKVQGRFVRAGRGPNTTSGGGRAFWTLKPHRRSPIRSLRAGDQSLKRFQVGPGSAEPGRRSEAWSAVAATSLDPLGPLPRQLRSWLPPLGVCLRFRVSSLPWLCQAKGL
ncbi:hypothetical protein SKAU_G00054930 [Synaphobranchus kaupii]|uniref:Uncharacterized protein n=1 Tax=Synaphobranchus kaupii TaxID=118154 RepID=A0A9Q1J9T1_SYNKA|nr:hypothetical protein SKAU_G00054930 [Synaphobranchus kaupii]